MAITIQYNKKSIATDANQALGGASYNPATAASEQYWNSNTFDLLHWLANGINGPVDLMQLAKHASQMEEFEATDLPTLQTNVTNITETLKSLQGDLGALLDAVKTEREELADLEKQSAAAPDDEDLKQKVADKQGLLQKKIEAARMTRDMLQQLVQKAQSAETAAKASNTTYSHTDMQQRRDELKSAFHNAEVILEEGEKVLGGASKPGPGPAPKPPKATKTPTGNGPNGQGPNGGASGRATHTPTQGVPPGPQSFDPYNAMQWWSQQDAMSSSMDDVFKLQGQSSKMMMMLLYLARAAMSGDLGAMYQFIRFIGFIINKDKAHQNIQLADKLIKLQAQSREMTQKLVDTPSYNANNPEVAANFQKEVETIKADQGMIATEQKLIAGMLEEMTQVSEMFTNLTKALLDARGRELQMVSRPG